MLKWEYTRYENYSEYNKGHIYILILYKSKNWLETLLKRNNWFETVNLIDRWEPKANSHPMFENGAIDLF